MKALQAWFKSIDGSDTYPLDQIIYRSPLSGSLLEVTHDLDALRQRKAKEWKELFAKRRSSFDPLDQSGIWCRREWVLPQIDAQSIVTLREGWSPLLHTPVLGKQLGIKDLRVKLCGNSHSGSFKDLGMTVLVSQVNHMIRSGIPIRAVACASTGDTSAALAAYCARAGIPSIVFLPTDKISVAQLIQPISSGSLVLSLDTDFDGCMAIVQEVTADSSIYLANSMNSLRVEGQKTIAPEICEELGWSVPDWVVIPGGNLGNVSALAKGFRDCYSLGLINKLPRIAVAQAANANPFYKAYKQGWDFSAVKAQSTLASAIQIGNPVSFPKARLAIEEFNGVVEEVCEEQLADIAHLADRSGLYCCPHTGVALGALQNLVKSGTIDADDSVVVVSTAHGLKFSEFKVGYHQKTHANMQCKYANSIFKLPAKAESVMDVLHRELKTGK